MESQPSMTNVYLVLGVGFIFLMIVGLYVYLTSKPKPEETPIASKSALEQPIVTLFEEPSDDTEHETAITSDHTNEQGAKHAMTESTGSWCFVGEDLSGRYCVQVPSDNACTSDRSFTTKGECEMVKASHMPAGIMRDGTNFRTLESMKFADDTRNTDR